MGAEYEPAVCPAAVGGAGAAADALDDADGVATEDDAACGAELDWLFEHVHPATDARTAVVITARGARVFIAREVPRVPSSCNWHDDILRPCVSP
jgi:hypothetical protein